MASWPVNVKANVLMLCSLLFVAALIGWLCLFPLTRPIPVDAAMHDLINRSATAIDRREFANEAHDIGHRIGEDSNGSLTDMFARCGDPEFAFGGCLHGVVMGQLHHSDIKDIAQLCQETKFKNELYNRNCSHGVGHGMFNKVASLDQLLRECRGTFNQTLEPDCQSGIIMEFMLATHSIAMGAEQPEIRYPVCASLQEEFRFVCAGAVGAYSLYYPGSSVEATVDICKKFERKEHVDYCYKAALSRLASAPVADTKSFCLTSNTELPPCPARS